MKFSQKLVDRGFLKPEDVQRVYTADDFIDIHHTMMKHYQCWIPVEEFKKTPIPTVLALLERINEERANPTPIRVVIAGILKKK